MLQIQESLNLCGFSIEVETVYIRKQLIWCTLFNRPSKKEAVLQTVSHYPVESDFELVSLVNKYGHVNGPFVNMLTLRGL